MKKFTILLLVLAVSCNKRKLDFYRENSVRLSVGQEVASGSEPSQSLTAQGLACGDITSTEALVDSLNNAHPEEQETLHRWIQKYIAWFDERSVRKLTLTPGEIQEYACLAHIQADKSGNKQLLKNYFYSLCDKIQKNKYGDTPLIEALEYTLQNIDSQVFGEDPSTLIDLGKDLLKKIKATALFSKNTYSTHRSLLYSLHQVLVLIQLIAPNQWDEEIYTLFKKQVEAIADNAQYYPFRYHALLLA